MTSQAAGSSSCSPLRSEDAVILEMSSPIELSVINQVFALHSILNIIIMDTHITKWSPGNYMVIVIKIESNQ